MASKVKLQFVVSQFAGVKIRRSITSKKLTATTNLNSATLLLADYMISYQKPNGLFMTG